MKKLTEYIKKINDAPVIIICGHYGAGKTNIAVNLTLELAENSRKENKIILADLDIVNPYFRSSDNTAEIIASGAEVIIPQYAGSNVDIPAIPGELKRVFLPGFKSVLDVGGDDSGAIVLSGYWEDIIKAGYNFIYIINESRLYIKSPLDASSMLSGIQTASGLKATCIINNTNLGQETNADIIRHGFDYAERVCSLTGLPLCATSIPESIFNAFSADEIEKYRICPIKDVTKKLYN
ncbi:MAG: ParA family protein [Oscillospiraceae bacterium]|nr:ParA family protein [Oscillospiraceae bacterium]